MAKPCAITCPGSRSVAIPELRFRGQAFRAHDPRWAWDPESGEAARQHGGRFNPVGVAALYLSLSFEAAWAEAQQAFPLKPQPLTLCAYEVDCERIVDLRDSLVRDALRITSNDLGCPWEDLLDRSITPPSHRLAEHLIADGVAGILVPSFAPGAPEEASNLVLWRWGSSLPHRIQCIDDEGRLPRLRG